ncbi:uncharacterized protein LOC106669191 [Cimex lectularius]|uniref:CPR type cuticle protein n=1 Tax=Cimex lectularius TaxID=79782 RepID=A0A8I6S1B5_CIMLE|nr:uncharacterized protein LOC106669191 [Cimex lectularius]
MKSAIVLVVCLFGYAAAGAVHGLGLVGLANVHDDGQWKPHLDGSVLGSGNLHWLGADLDDGQWKPHLDNSFAGQSGHGLLAHGLVGHGLVGHGLVGHGLVGHHLYKRSV